MDVRDIVNLIKNVIWLIIGLLILPIAIATLWLLIIFRVSVNVFDATVFEYITTYLIIFLGMMITTGLSSWFWRVVKNVFQLTRIKELFRREKF